MTARLSWGILTVVAWLLSAPPAARATKVRLNALGGAEKWITVADEANVLLLPSTLVAFGDRVFVDLVQPDDPIVEFGTHWSLTSK